MPNYETVGIGQYVACYALDLVRNPVIGVERGKFIAAYGIKAAKDYVDGCGKKTNIWTLDDAGVIHYATASEIADLEEYCDALTDALSFLPAGLDFDDLSPADLDTLVQDFRSSLAEFKIKQKKRQDARQRALMKKQSKHP